MLPHDHIGIPSFSAGNSKQAFRRNFPKGIPSFFKGPLSLSRPLFQGFPAFFKRSLCFPSVIFQEIPMPFSRNRRDRHNNRFPKRYPLCQGHMIIRSLSLSPSLSHLAHPYQHPPSQTCKVACQCNNSFLFTSYAASSPLWHTAVSSNYVRRPAFLFHASINLFHFLCSNLIYNWQFVLEC